MCAVYFIVLLNLLSEVYISSDYCTTIYQETREVMIIKIYTDVVYSNEYCDSRKLDIYCPQDNNGITIMLIHGGGWQTGSKSQWQEVIDYLTSKKFVCVSVGYRLVDKKKFPAQIEDVRTAMYFLRNKASEYGVPSQKIIALGSSAGATLAVTLGMLDASNDLGLTAEIQDSNNAPDAIVAYYPVSTLRTDMKYWQCRECHPDFIMNYLGVTEDESPQTYQCASLLENEFESFVPMLLIHGTADKTVPIYQSELLADKLQKLGHPVEFCVVDGAEHAFAYRLQSEVQYSTLNKAIDFINKII